MGYAMGKVLVTGVDTDVVFAEVPEVPEYVGMFGFGDEFLWLFGPEDADFFEAAAAMLRKRGQEHV